MPRPGEVATDEQAFRQILSRFEGEVGTMIGLIELGRDEKGLFPNTAPFWSLVRMMFPVAESIGDVIYRSDSSVQNLRSVLEKDFEAVRTGYAGKSAILALLYRHALTHQDELQSLTTRGKELGWRLSYMERAHHLEMNAHSQEFFTLHFDTTAFFDDIVAVCRNALKQSWGGGVMTRYNGWLTCNLDAEQQNKGVRDAIAAIAALK
jgi:hypothetical protein